MIHRILHWVPSKTSNRVYESFLPHNGIEQAIVSSDKNYKIEKIFHCSPTRPGKGIKKAIKMFKPTILTQCDLSTCTVSLVKKYNLKYVFINHGFWPKSPNNMIKFKDEYWKNFDLFCGATNTLEEIFAESTRKMNIVTDALPQFDTLYNRTRKPTKTRRKLTKKYGAKNPKIIITYFGNVEDRFSLEPFNRGFYETAIKLNKLASKNDWFVLIKTKNDSPRKYLSSKHEWVKEIKKNYMNLENVRFVNSQDDTYDLFCSDVIINSARSTVDIEAALAGKPLIRVWLHGQELTEDILSYETGVLDFSAAIKLENINDLEELIISCSKNNLVADNQKKFIDSLGITFDGKAHVRALEAMKKL